MGIPVVMDIVFRECILGFPCLLLPHEEFLREALGVGISM